MNKNSWSLKQYIVKDKENNSHKINCYGHTLKGANNIDSHLTAYFKNLGKSSLLNTPIIADDLKGIKVIQQQAQKKQQDFMKTIKDTTQRAREENIKMGAPSNPTPFTRIPPPTVGAPPSAFQQASKTQSTLSTVTPPSAFQQANKTQPTLADATKIATAAITAQADKAQKLVTQTVSNTVDAAKEAINNARENLAAAISPPSISQFGGRRTRRRKKRKRRRTKHKRKKKKSTRRRRKTRRRRRK